MIQPQFLLASIQNSLNVKWIFQITKSLIVLADKLAPEPNNSLISGRNSRNKKENSYSNHKESNQFPLILSPIAHYHHTFYGMQTNTLLALFKNKKDKAFGYLARRCLKLLTAQQCVKDNIVSTPVSKFITEEAFCPEDCINFNQMQLLIQHYLYPKQQLIDAGVPNPLLLDPFEFQSSDEKLSYMVNQNMYLSMVVSHMNLWNMRQTILEIEVMYHVLKMTESSTSSISSSTNHEGPDGRSSTSPIDFLKNTIEEDISNAVVNMFSKNITSNADYLKLSVNLKIHSAWLINFLVKNLSKVIQNTVWEKCKLILQDPHGIQKLSAPQPFLLLILENSTRNGAQMNIEELLHTILDHVVTLLKNNSNLSNSSSLKKEEIETLPLRLSLIGGLLNLVYCKTEIIKNITEILIKLIARGLVNHSESSSHDLFYTTYDMLAVILWNYLGGDHVDQLPVEMIKSKEFAYFSKVVLKETDGKDIYRLGF